MKKQTTLKSALALGFGAVALMNSAQAQYTGPRGNLTFGAVQNPAQTFDFVVDLGANNAYQAYTGIAAPNQGARLLGGTSASEAYQGITFASENRFSTSDLLSTLGGSLNNLLWSVGGIDSEASATVNSTFFMTRSRLDANVQSVPWARASAFSQGGTGNAINNSQINAVNNGTDFNNTSTKEATAGGQSYSTLIPPAGYAEMENGTGPSFSGLVRSDLYYVAPGTGASDYLGYFEFQADGDLWFIPENFVPVPEVSSYGLVAGAGLLFLALRRRLTGKMA